MDFLEAITGILKHIGKIIWNIIIWPMNFIISLPQYIKIILLLIIILIIILITRKIIKDYLQDKLLYIKT